MRSLCFLGDFFGCFFFFFFFSNVYFVKFQVLMWVSPLSPFLGCELLQFCPKYNIKILQLLTVIVKIHCFWLRNVFPNLPVVVNIYIHVYK